MDYTPRHFLSVPEAAKEMHTKPETLRALAFRKEDPFPVRLLPWNKSHGIVMVSEMQEWYMRNARPLGGEIHGREK